jgi:hypothetical protein
MTTAYDELPRSHDHVCSLRLISLRMQLINQSLESDKYRY